MIESESKRTNQQVAASMRVRLWVGILKIVYRPVIRSACKKVLIGRYRRFDDPKSGRWLKSDLDGFLRELWTCVDELLPQANLEVIPTYGNRQNVFLAVVTTAAYRVLINQGSDKKWASQIVSDVGWYVYAKMLKIAFLPWRLTTLDPQKRMDRTLRALMFFPFSAPGSPGYEVDAFSKDGRFYTHWKNCPPQAFVRRLIESGTDQGELEAFYNSWRMYDWPGADILSGGSRGKHYDRNLTLSRGDNVCDMCWMATESKGEGSSR